MNLCKFWRYHRRVKKRAVKLVIHIGPPGAHMSTSITVIQQVPGQISGSLDAKGNTLPVPSFTTPPSWTSSDTTVLTVAPAADGLSAVITAVGKIGSATITVSGTPTGETAPIQGSADISVTAAQPASLVLSLGTPVLQTPPVPPPPPGP